MADGPKVLSLSAARKARARASARAEADANAVKFGLSKAEKAAGRSGAARREKALDGHRRETGPQEPDAP